MCCGAGRLIPAMLVLASLLASCYLQAEPESYGEIALRVGLADTAVTETVTHPTLSALSTITATEVDGFIVATVMDTAMVARYRTTLNQLYDRLKVEAVFDAGLYPRLTLRQLYAELGVEIPGDDMVNVTLELRWANEPGAKSAQSCRRM